MRSVSYLFLAILLFLAGCTTRKQQEAVVYVEPPKRGTIVLDAGHGGEDTGARSHGLQEKKLAFATTLQVKKKLEELGYSVILTRASDEYIPLPRRVAIAKGYPGCLFVSIHFNSSHNKQAHGIEIFFYEKDNDWRAHASKRLASCVLDKLIHLTAARSRGVKHGNFHVIRETEVPAILIEAGFITNPQENTLLRDQEYFDRVTSGIARGIHEYFLL